MGYIATSLFGWSVIVGATTFVALYVVSPGFRDAINHLIMGTG